MPVRVKLPYHQIGLELHMAMKQDGTRSLIDITVVRPQPPTQTGQKEFCEEICRELRAWSADARALWTQVMEQRVGEVSELIERERARGVAPAGPPPRELAIALLQMNERAQQATIAGEAPALAEDGLIDVLLEVWLRAIYGASAPA